MSREDRQTRGSFIAKLRLDLLSYFRRRVPREDVEDQVQETFKTASEKLKKTEADGSEYRRLVFGVARYRLLSYFNDQDRRRRGREPIGSWVPQDESVEEAMLWLERSGLVRGMLHEIRTALREAFESRLLDEDPAEFAKAHGIQPATVRSNLKRAIEEIRDKLAARQKTPKLRY